MKHDTFYKIMAMVSQDEDTLASWNGMVNPNEIGPGDVLIIPNARGLFSKKEKRQIQKKYGASADKMVAFGEGWFLPGRKFDPGERDMFRGRGFQSPLRIGRVSSRFGYRIDPFSKRSAFHGGVDIAAPTGTPVFATRDGVVVKAASQGGYGKLVRVRHAYGYETYYGHLSRINVKAGQKVRKGERLGLVGSTGRSTGPHLHFEVRKNGSRRRPQIHGL
jgi:murein DD-endopeptidase MepM/ murein hydrolase activator NlpD